MPIVGSFAGASARAYGLGAGGVAIGDFESISTTTLSVAASSVTFSSIPATYTHLQIRYIARATVDDNTSVRFNGDTASNYSNHYLYGQGASVASAAILSSFFYIDILTASSTTYNAAIVDILDYANTNKYKTARAIAGIDLNGSGNVWLASGNWRNTAAITSITLFLSNGNYQQYSSFALYGVKA